MSCRRPTAITVDGKCVSCFTGIMELMPVIRPMKEAANVTWTKRGLEILAQRGIRKEDVRIVKLEEA